MKFIPSFKSFCVYVFCSSSLIAVILFFFISNVQADTTVRKLSSSVGLIPTISAAAVYASGDAIGGKLTFAGATSSKKSGTLNSIVIIDNDKENSAMDLVCFCKDFTATADNAAINISDADAINIIFSVAIAAADYKDIGGASVANLGNLGKQFTLSENTSVFCQLIARSTPTYTLATDLKLVLQFFQD